MTGSLLAEPVEGVYTSSVKQSSTLHRVSSEMSHDWTPRRARNANEPRNLLRQDTRLHTDGWCFGSIKDTRPRARGLRRQEPQVPNRWLREGNALVAVHVRIHLARHLAQRRCHNWSGRRSPRRANKCTQRRHKAHALRLTRHGARSAVKVTSGLRVTALSAVLI